jgi:hypothetical protein
MSSFIPPECDVSSLGNKRDVARKLSCSSCSDNNIVSKRKNIFLRKMIALVEKKVFLRSFDNQYKWKQGLNESALLRIEAND